MLIAPVVQQQNIKNHILNVLADKSIMTSLILRFPQNFCDGRIRPV